MTDTKELKKMIDASGLKLVFIANELDLTTAGLRKKIDGSNEFKASEIVKMADILKMTKDQRDDIFLTIR